MHGSFFFVTSEIEFQEATEKGARVLATFMELDRPSQNDRMYRFEEGEALAKSLIGKDIKFGANWLGKHLKKVPIIGIVESAWQEAKKIKGIARIWDQGIIETLKSGTKYLFSVGGVAEFGKWIKDGVKYILKLFNAKCTHLQMLPNDPEGAGFPSAKMEKLIEINESVMYIEDITIQECDAFGCKVLAQIKKDYEFEETKKKIIMEKAINTAIAEDIAAIIRRIPDLVVETEN